MRFMYSLENLKMRHSKKLATFCDSRLIQTKERISLCQVGKSHSTLLSRNSNLPFVIQSQYCAKVQKTRYNVVS